MINFFKERMIIHQDNQMRQFVANDDAMAF